MDTDAFLQQFDKREKIHRRKELLNKISAWLLLAGLIAWMWWHHRSAEDRDAITSQAWSFGEPGE
jgi:hypothetical protein